jgi:hypothetical protein
MIFPEYQFVCPDPQGSELIFPAPFKVGVIMGNRFADKFLLAKKMDA